MQCNDGDAMLSGEFAAVLIEHFVAQLAARFIDFVEDDCGGLIIERFRLQAD